MDGRIRALWARARVRAWPGGIRPYSFAPDRLAAVAAAAAAVPSGYLFLLRERDEVSAAVPEEARTGFDALSPRDAAGPFRAITVDLDVDLAASGFLLPAAEALAREGISIVPQCAFLKDHLLVREEDGDRAVAALEGLIAEASGGGAGGSGASGGSRS